MLQKKYKAGKLQVLPLCIWSLDVYFQQGRQLMDSLLVSISILYSKYLHDRTE